MNGTEFVCVCSDFTYGCSAVFCGWSPEINLRTLRPVQARDHIPGFVCPGHMFICACWSNKFALATRAHRKPIVRLERSAGCGVDGWCRWLCVMVCAVLVVEDSRWVPPHSIPQLTLVAMAMMMWRVLTTFACAGRPDTLAIYANARVRRASLA